MSPVAVSRLDAWLTRALQGGLLLLVGLMPLHAFITVSLGTWLGHRTLIQSWKELLLVLLALAAVALWWRRPARWSWLRQPVVIAIAVFVVIGLLVTTFARPQLEAVAVGLKTDYEFLVAFVLALLVTTPQFVRRLVTITLGVGGLVIGFGLLQATVLPPDFLVQFGYGADTVPPYLVLDPAVDSLRFGSTLGGPNQLGAYLITVLCLALAVGWRRRRLWLALIPLGLIVLVNTHSRSAWIGLAVGVAIVIIGSLARRWRWVAGFSLVGAGIGGVVSALTLAGPGSKLRYYVFHGIGGFEQKQGSDYEHLASLQSGLQAVGTNPLGHGLGTAGPAFFHTGSGRIIENYYLQLGYETGLPGLAAFVAVVVAAAYGLWQRLSASPVALALLAALAGTCTTALVLPAWTDSTTALVFWTLAGAVLGLTRKELERV